MPHFTLTELQEIGWVAYRDSESNFSRHRVDAAVKAVYENMPRPAVVPLHPSWHPHYHLQRFDAGRYKHLLLIGIEDPKLKPDVFSFGNGATPLEEVGALFTALRIRSEGETT